MTLDPRLPLARTTDSAATDPPGPPGQTLSPQNRRQQDPPPVDRALAFDWGTTPAGPIADWPPELTAAWQQASHCGFPMVLLIGREGLMLFNDAAAALIGPGAAAWLGQPLAALRTSQTELLLNLHDRALQGQPSHLQGLHLLTPPEPEARGRWFDIDLAPLGGASGPVHGTLAIIIETTAQRDKSLTRERLNMALEASDILGIWELDFERNLMRANARFARLHGVAVEKAASGTTPQEFLAAVHPEDRAATEETLWQARESGDLVLRHRVLGPEGQRWLLSTARFGPAAAPPPGTPESGTPETGAPEIAGPGPTGAPLLIGTTVDVTDQVEVTGQLADSEARFRGYAETLPHIIFTWTAEGAPHYANRRWSEFSGRAPDDPDFFDWQSLVHPDDRPAFVSAWRRAIDNRQDFSAIARFRAADLGYRWMRGVVLPMQPGGGQIEGWIGTLTDVHEARLAQEERELISQELDHRLKNFFTLVQSLVSLSQRDGQDVADFSRELRGRLASLYRAHALLRDPNQGIETRGLQSLLCRSLAPYLTKDQSARLQVSGDDPPLAPGLVTPFALIFHELATNAVKHGALAHPTGQLQIHVQALPDRLTLLWQETGTAPGGPRPQTAPDLGPGFGARLIRILVEDQLQGRLAQDWQDGGLQTRIDIPLAPQAQQG